MFILKIFKKNLENAHKYGITTIHIKEKDFDNIKIESFIDFRFSSLIKALKEINKNFTKKVDNVRVQSN